jgi:hypothetical protein
MIDVRRGGAVEDDREKANLASDEGEDVEGHLLDLSEGEKRDADEGEDVEGHKR